MLVSFLLRYVKRFLAKWQNAKLHKIAYKNLPFKKKSRNFALNMTSHASRWISAPGEVFEFYMIYNKKPLTLQEQVNKLKSRAAGSREPLAIEVKGNCEL